MGRTPVPVKVTVRGLPLALSVMVKLPAYAVATVGVKVTLIVHFPAAAIGLTQLFVCEKPSVALILLIVNDAAVPLVSVIATGLLLLPRAIVVV